MKFTEHQVKGIRRHLLDKDLKGEPLHMHISEVDAGSRVHHPHHHGGFEGIYMLDGECTFRIEDETYILSGMV